MSPSANCSATNGLSGNGGRSSNSWTPLQHPSWHSVLRFGGVGGRSTLTASGAGQGYPSPWELPESRRCFTTHPPVSHGSCCGSPRQDRVQAPSQRRGTTLTFGYAALKLFDLGVGVVPREVRRVTARRCCSPMEGSSAEPSAASRKDGHSVLSIGERGEVAVVVNSTASSNRHIRHKPMRIAMMMISGFFLRLISTVGLFGSSVGLAMSVEPEMTSPR
jgi:hypothetical protein